jgi:hypothetical protein
MGHISYWYILKIQHILLHPVMLLASYSLGLLFDPEEGGSMFLRKVDGHLPDYTTSYYWKLENILY